MTSLLADLVRVVPGDCHTYMLGLDDACIDLIVTSPPYADRRQDTYGGIDPDKYVAWFSPISLQLLRVLKPSGSFVLNIKEGCVDGERHEYVLQLIQHMRAQGWKWIEEYVWCKGRTTPGKWPLRFRDMWERCLHFAPSLDISIYQDQVTIPIDEERLLQRYEREAARSDKRKKSGTGSGFGYKPNCMGNRTEKLPGNVLHLYHSTKKDHPACFPEGLPEFFIKLFTKPGDWVLDPFAGSGTTLDVAARLSRRALGVEKHYPYYEELRKRYPLD